MFSSRHMRDVRTSLFPSGTFVRLKAPSKAPRGPRLPGEPLPEAEEGNRQRRATFSEIASGLRDLPATLEDWHHDALRQKAKFERQEESDLAAAAGHQARLYLVLRDVVEHLVTRPDEEQASPPPDPPLAEEGAVPEAASVFAATAAVQDLPDSDYVGWLKKQIATGDVLLDEHRLKATFPPPGLVGKHQAYVEALDQYRRIASRAVGEKDGRVLPGDALDEAKAQLLEQPGVRLEVARGVLASLVRQLESLQIAFDGEQKARKQDLHVLEQMAEFAKRES